MRQYGLKSHHAIKPICLNEIVTEPKKKTQTKPNSGSADRRMKLQERDAEGKTIVLSIKPSSVMPYMTGYTDKVEKAHYLRQFGVPSSALTYVFGRNDSYLYRQTTHFGRYSLVQTTIQQPENLPQDLLADEKHSRLQGENVILPRQSVLIAG